MTPELREVLETQRAETDRWQRLRKRIIPWVFHQRGKPIRDYRTAWRTEAKGISLQAVVEAGTTEAVLKEARESARA